MNQSSTCPYCNTLLPTLLEDTINFCPACGKNLKIISSRINLKLLLISLFLAIFLGGIGYFYNENYLGKRPTLEHSKIQKNKTKQDKTEERLINPEISKLKDEASQDPTNIQKLKKLGSLLLSQIRLNFHNKQEDQEVILDAVDTYSKVLGLDKNDQESILALADLSFEQKLFNKAIEMYERYLTLNPDDSSIKAKLGSSYSFIKDYKKAEEILREVIKKDPDNFQAHAYLGVVLSQNSKLEEAKQEIELAILKAPSEEAKLRLTQFQNSLSSKKDETLHEIESASSSTKNLDTFYQELRKHPIAGSKFTRGVVEGIEGTGEGKKLVLYFKDFPIAQMPDFAKEKFISGLERDSGMKVEIREE